MRRTLAQIAGIPAPQRYREGGHVRGPGTGTSDSIPAMLSDGEFVLPADTVRKVGVRRLRDLIDDTHAPVKSKGPNHLANGDFPSRGFTKFDNDAFVQSMEQQRAAHTQASLAAGQAAMDQAQADSDVAAKRTQTAAPSPAAAAPSSQPLDQRVSQIPTDGMKAPAADGSQSSWTNTETGRNLSNIAAALPAAGTMVRSGRMVGSAVQSATAAGEIGAVNAGGAAFRALALPAVGAATMASTSSAEQPSPSARERLLAAGGAGAGRGSVNPPMVDPSKPLPQPEPSSASQSGYGPIGDRTTLTNAQAATMNPAGRITATRQPDGTMSFSGGSVSGQVSYNDASGKALPGGGINGKGFSGFDVAPAGANVALGPNGSYAFGSGSGSGSGSAQPPSPAAQRSPVGMTVDEAQRQGLVGARVGYNPAYDTRLAGQGGQPTAQNTGAADNLAASQGQSGRARLMALAAGPGSGPVEAGSFTGGFTGVVGASSTNGNMRGRSPEQRLRDAEVSASSITNTQRWGGRDARNNPAMLEYRAALQQDNNIRQNQAGADLEAMRQTGSLQREGLQQAGETQRTGIRTQGVDAANQIARGRLTLDQIAAGYTNRAADRIDRAQVDLENAETPEVQRSARERLLALAGKAPQNEWGMTVTPSTKNLDGTTTQGSVWKHNKTTGETARVDEGQGKPAPQFEVGKTYVDGNGRRATFTAQGWKAA